MNWYNVMLIFALIACTLCVKKKNEQSEETFVPSKEWKVIKEGQKVPAGLHYRINLSTGKKEAKLNDDSEPESQKGFSLVNSEETVSKEDETISDRTSSKKFRTLNEIEEDLGDLVSIKTDVEILQKLFEKYEREFKKEENSNEIVTILQHFINLAHQIDNANEFTKMQGFTKIVYKQLNSTSIPIKQEALQLFSTLTQNNPQVKIHVLETGGLTILLRLLYLPENQQIYSNIVTALSCTLRTFPFAQNKFVDSGGLTLFTSLFKTNSIKLKLKLTTLLTDLVQERQTDLDNFKNHNFVDIEEKLVELGWCEYLNTLLEDIIKSHLYDHDSIDKSLNAMKTFIKKCGKTYKKKPLLHLHYSYEKVIQADADDYFKGVFDVIKVLLEVSSEEVVKEEL